MKIGAWQAVVEAQAVPALFSAAALGNLKLNHSDTSTTEGRA